MNDSRLHVKVIDNDSYLHVDFVPMYICICHQITDREIRRAVEQGANTLGKVQLQLPVGGCCGRCIDSARALIAEQQHGLSGVLNGRVAAAA